jgi:predicted regulator of Ras-like GTPase activity (Roadblock/LC7/MglB family)
MSMIKQLPSLLERLTKELPGFLAAAVVNCDDGLAIAELSVQPEIETAAAAAYLSSIVKSNRKAIRLLANNEITEDIIISTGQYHFIIRDLTNFSFFLFVMTGREEWLGRTKMIMQSFEKELIEIILKTVPVQTYV